MGSGVSRPADPTSPRAGVLSRLGVYDTLSTSSRLPLDGSDLPDEASLRAEVGRLRGAIKTVTELMDSDHSRRSLLSSAKLDRSAFKASSLKASLADCSEFVNQLISTGYDDMEVEQRYRGLKELKGFVQSPALHMLLARLAAGDDLKKKIEDNKDSAVSEFIVAEYASSGGVHDVSIKKAPKERLGNAMRKLKGQMMVSSIMNFNKTHDAQSHRSRQTASFLSSSPYLGAGDKKELEELLSDMGSWDFDVWDVVKTSKNQVMLVCGMELLKRWNLDADLKIKDTAICAFFSEIEKGYLNNPYHNNKHGADVMYTVSAFIEHSPRMSGTLQPQDIFAALIAAAAHDYKHDGFNNAFHMNTGSTVALTYNDISVLESMHAAELFLMCHRKKHANIFSVLDQVAFKEVRKIITTAILGTDMAKHFNHIADFTSRLSAEEAMIANHDGEHAMDDAEHVGLDKYIMIDMALHCADISNPVKTLSIYQKWVVVVMNEFYQQGDKERELGIPISPMFDRNNSSVSKTQYGFINFIIKPIFVAWGRFIPELGPEFTKNVEAGLNFDWDSYYKEEVKRREEEAAKKEVEEDEQGGGEEKEDDPLMTEATHAEV